MRFTFISILMMLSFSALAMPVALNGTYQFRGRVVPMFRNTVDVIDQRLPGAQRRVEQLKSQGAQCQMVNSLTWRCLTQKRASEVPMASLQRSQQQNRGLRVDFGPLRATPAVVTSGDTVIEWHIPQGGRWNNGTFDSYRYLELIGAVNKIVLPARGSELWLNFENGLVLRRFESVFTTESEWRFHEDGVEALLER